MKILNLFSGLGGNRAYWPDDAEVTAVESDPNIARFYSDNYPQDTMVIGDAREYLVEHYKEFDFIWSSPPCQSHSKMRYVFSKGGQYPPVMPDMSLWSEIVFLQYFFEGKWVVENVQPYYPVFIKPEQKLGRHLFWSNFEIPYKEFDDSLKINEYKRYFELSGYKFPGQRHDQIQRNCTSPKIGKYIYDLVV